MNDFEKLTILIDLYKLDPSDKCYHEIENIMISYQANTPDIVRENMKHKSIQKIMENPTTISDDIVESLIDAFSNFINYPTNANADSFKRIMQEYKTRFNANN
ncbi:hypothetical protein IQ227_17285 [Anabaena aphanizomenioides LEGE 00250]|uniref:CdiI immunity protein domain-containing protein n=2 Tax=Sphaerospermopsis aphanizomenoides TaxID=459663 RepID=A0ABR9VGX4_9CYAN|nr:hypothetical protein [Sphaerospermopsis sp. LEGE 00249]MBC5796562.1 hypothetical protein [Sphaerospermopsis sp. LEGE 00249]MBE9237734.1 hypothetical protein [Sphaerospermopsis aphanizomenoides LEGE 00250]